MCPDRALLPLPVDDDTSVHVIQEIRMRHHGRFRHAHIQAEQADSDRGRAAIGLCPERLPWSTEMLASVVNYRPIM